MEGPRGYIGWPAVSDSGAPVGEGFGEALGQVQEEVALHSLPQTMEAHAVFEEAVDDGGADPVGILGSWSDPLDVRAERLSPGTGGAVFSDRQFDDGDLAARDVASGSPVGVLPSSGRTTVWTGEGFRRSTLSENANSRGVHACVLAGLVW
jgi:hypothetical protein